MVFDILELFQELITVLNRLNYPSSLLTSHLSQNTLFHDYFLYVEPLSVCFYLCCSIVPNDEQHKQHKKKVCGE
jgi:hypothetical protein